MPPEGDPAEVARAWLLRAKGNMARAKQPKPAEGFWEDLCFDAQQAAEKAVKAVLVFHQIDFPRSHDITELLVIVREAGYQPPVDIWNAGRLSHYAVATRYPSEVPPVDEAQYRDALQLAEGVVGWAEAIVRGA